MEWISAKRKAYDVAAVKFIGDNLKELEDFLECTIRPTRRGRYYICYSGGGGDDIKPGQYIIAGDGYAVVDAEDLIL